MVGIRINKETTVGHNAGIQLPNVPRVVSQFIIPSRVAQQSCNYLLCVFAEGIALHDVRS
jgi:hypothetical protein